MVPKLLKKPHNVNNIFILLVKIIAHGLFRIYLRQRKTIKMGYNL